MPKPATPEEIRAHQIAFVSTGISIKAPLDDIRDVVKMITPTDNYQHNVSASSIVRHDLEHRPR